MKIIAYNSLRRPLTDLQITKVEGPRAPKDDEELEEDERRPSSTLRNLGHPGRPKDDKRRKEGEGKTRDCLDQL